MFMSDSYFLWEPLSSGKGAGKLSTVPRRPVCSCYEDGKRSNGRVAGHREELQPVPNLCRPFMSTAPNATH